MPFLPHPPHRPHHATNDEPLPEVELIDGLEADQLVSATARPLERMALSRRADLGLWTLRIFVLVMTGFVIYTFVQALP